MTQSDPTPKPDDAVPDTSADLPAIVKLGPAGAPPADPAAARPPLELRREMNTGYRALRDAQAAAPDEAPEPAPNPAALRGMVEIHLQTKTAQDLAAGRSRMAGGSTPERRSTPVIGLLTFAKQVRLLHRAASIDDPYASWFLLRVTRECEAAKAEFARLSEDAQGLMTMPGLRVTVGESGMVFAVPLMFSTPHAFRGAYLLLELDRYVRLILTAHHIGLIDRDQKHRRLEESAHLCRRVFAIPGQYVYLELTRADVRNGTARAEQARQRMGALPAEVLDGPTLDPYAPDPRRGPTPEVARRIGDDLQGAFARRNQRWSDRQAERGAATNAESGSGGE